jgi:hypothetical protein
MNYMIDPDWLIDACPQLLDVPKVAVLHGGGAARCYSHNSP